MSHYISGATMGQVAASTATDITSIPRSAVSLLIG